MPNLVGTGLDQVPTNGMLGGMAYQSPDHASIKSLDLKNLSQINSEIADTAVDVFVYDTSKDSDGGAWRKRTQSTSWYNETLNTSTRGARKEFPAVAVIVAESDKVTIYDGDDPDLPMWMVLNADSSDPTKYAIVRSVGKTISSLYALNGIICDPVSYNGLFYQNFVGDACYRVNTTNTIFGGSIVNRNGGMNFALNVTSSGLVHATVNDVAMTVLPNAPIDPSTGLPIPTIAVATDGGLSIIKDDGSVVDATPSSSGWYPTTVSTYERNKFIMGTFSTAGGYILPVFNSDTTYNIVSTPPSNGWLHFRSNGSNADIYLDLNENPATTGLPITALSSMGVGSAKGMNFFDVNDNSHSNSLVAYVTSHYSTGWQHGDIKGAFLSDTDTTNVVGGNLVSNGTFDTDVSGWSASASGNGTTITRHVDGSGNSSLRVVSDASTYGSAVTPVALESNTTYVLSYFLRSTGGTTAYYARTGYGTDVNGTYYSNIHGDNSATVDAQNTFTFTTGTISSGTQYLKLASRNDGTDFRYDNISLCKAEEDRSVNKNGLQVFGTVTKTPVATGADLVAYHGMSASNYLKQPYNSDLDFGTGDFSILVWVLKNNLSSNHYVMDRAPAPFSSSGRAYFIIASSGYHRFRLAGGNEVTGNVKAMQTGVYNQIGFVRRNGQMEFYLNGELVQTMTGSSASASFHSGGSQQEMVIDRYWNGFSHDYTFDRMALFRISGSAPSAEQIKKMYNDEKVLFQENAKCTLYESSDAVTALAYDPTTSLLHVGTSGGRSTFSGLKRVENTTTAVTTAISAHDGFIIEQ